MENSIICINLPLLSPSELSKMNLRKNEKKNVSIAPLNYNQIFFKN